MTFVIELALFLWLLCVLGMIADAIDRWAGGPEQRESRRRHRR